MDDYPYILKCFAKTKATVNIQGDIDQGAFFHIDAHAAAATAGALEDHAQIVDGQIFVKLQPKLAQLERDVGIHIGLIHPLDEIHNLVAGGVGFGGCFDAFSQEVQGDTEAAAVELPCSFDGLVDRFTGYEAACHLPGWGKPCDQRTRPARTGEIEQQRAQPAFAIAVQQPAAAGKCQERQ